MKRQVSVTGLITVLLLGVGGVLLCAQLGRSPSPFRVDLGAALAIELALYAVALVAWNQSYTVPGYLAGVAAMFAFRALISAGAALVVSGQSDSSVVRALNHAFTGAPALLAAAVVAVVMFLPLAGLLPQREKKERAPKEPATKEAAPTVAQTAAAVVEQVVADQAPAAPAAAPAAKNTDYLRHLLPRPVPQVEGIVVVPLSVITDQLPAALLPEDGPTQGEAEFPINLVLPEMQEGVVKLPLATLAEYLPAGVLRFGLDLETLDEEPPLITLPLEVLVPQLPPEAFHPGDVRPPHWAQVDPELESILFAQA